MQLCVVDVVHGFSRADSCECECDRGEAVTCEGWRLQYGSSVHIHMSLRWHLQFSIRRELT